MTHKGWGSFGSLTWHDHMISSLDSVEKVGEYLVSLDIKPPSFTELEEAHSKALRLVEEKVNGFKDMGR